MVHEGHHYFLIVFEVILDELVEFCLLLLGFLGLFLLLNQEKGTSMDISFCYLAFIFTVSREVSLRLTLRTRLTVFSSLVFMKFIRAYTAYLIQKVPLWRLLSPCFAASASAN